MNAIGAHYATPQSPASTQWIAEHVNDLSSRIVEVIWGRQPAFGIPIYEAGNNLGAINLPAHREVDAEGSIVDWRLPTVDQNDTQNSYQALRIHFDGIGIPPFVFCNVMKGADFAAGVTQFHEE